MSSSIRGRINEPRNHIIHIIVVIVKSLPLKNQPGIVCDISIPSRDFIGYDSRCPI
jgi:hypothetical protein